MSSHLFLFHLFSLGRAVCLSRYLRYVKCARNEEEQNLTACQYRGGILYRCCQPIKPGQELLVGYEEEYAKLLGLAFDSLWKRKCSTNGYFPALWFYYNNPLHLWSPTAIAFMSSNRDPLAPVSRWTDPWWDCHLMMFQIWDLAQQENLISLGTNLPDFPVDDFNPDDFYTPPTD